MNLNIIHAWGPTVRWRDRAGRLASPRRLMRGLLLLGAGGLVLELAFMEHWGTPVQAIPFGILCVAIVAGLVAWSRAAPPTPWAAAFEWTMAAVVATGLAGIGLHYYGNAAFEREMDPEAGGVSLVWKSLRGGVPVLAPGALVQLGLFGLILSRFTKARDGRASESQQREET